MSFKIIKNKIIEDSLRKNNRQYLLGDLKCPQDLNYIFDNNNEIGISDIKEYQVDIAHYHSVCTEYQYVIKGNTKYLDFYAILLHSI